MAFVSPWGLTHAVWTACSLQEKVERVSAASVEVERRLAAGLQDLQAEWQATAASLKAEAAAVAEAKCGDTERRLGAALGSKIDTNAHAAQREGAELRRRIADLERGKVDKASMEKFTTEVLDVSAATTCLSPEALKLLSCAVVFYHTGSNTS